jgi:hypothetical protein
MHYISLDNYTGDVTWMMSHFNATITFVTVYTWRLVITISMVLRGHKGAYKYVM